MDQQLHRTPLGFGLEIQQGRINEAEALGRLRLYPARPGFPFARLRSPVDELGKPLWAELDWGVGPGLKVADFATGNELAQPGY